MDKCRHHLAPGNVKGLSNPTIGIRIFKKFSVTLFTKKDELGLKVPVRIEFLSEVCKWEFLENFIF